VSTKREKERRRQQALLELEKPLLVFSRTHNKKYTNVKQKDTKQLQIHD
jgi:hypothetical protein